MYTTKNDLPERARERMIELLNSRLAYWIDLLLMSKQAHCNVKGPSFYSLHLLFDKVAEDVQEYVDEIAERVAQLGGSVAGTLRMAAQRTILPEYPPGIADGLRHVEALSSAIAAYGKEVRYGIEAANEVNDADTADLFTEVSRGLDKWLWMVEAHLQR